MQRVVSRRLVHLLNVPEATLHSPVSSFKLGIPQTQVRELLPREKNWDFWTSSDAFTPKDSHPAFLV